MPLPPSSAVRRLGFPSWKPLHLAPIVTLAFLGGGCGAGDSILLPGDGVPAHLEVLSGDGQSGRVSEPLPKPVVIQVTDSKGRAVEGADVTFAWTAAGPGANVVPASTTTDADGKAEAQVVLGTTIGTQTGEARVVMGEGDPPKVSFTATALSENANGIAAVSGDEQQAPVGSLLPAPLVVAVTDAFGNPISGIVITWAAEGGGSVSQTSVTTDEQGRASVERTLGPTAGPQSTVASAENLAGSPVTFSHIATAGNASGLSIVSGDGQTAAAGTRLPGDLVVRLVDAAGNGVPSAAVTWLVGAGGGSVTPEDGTTDEAGRSSAQWTLGSNPGENRVDAVVSGVGVVSFRATGTLGSPAALAIQTQPSSSARNSEPLDRQPVVQVKDAQGHDVGRGGVVITAQLNGGGGALIGTRQRTTDPNGRATFTDLAIVGAEGRRRLAFTASGFAGAISNEITLRPAATTTTITSDDPDPSTAGTSFTVVVRVASGGLTPTGRVTVSSNGNGPSCTVTLAGGSGSCPLTLNVVGDRTLTASYSGAPGLDRSSGTAPHRVNPATVPNRMPNADYNWTCDGLTCQFTDHSSDPDGRITGWDWDFGDGTAHATGPNPAHTFPGPNRYTVTLTATDNGGATDQASAGVEVKAPPPPPPPPPPPANKPPHAEFDVSCADLTCTFTDRSTDDDGNLSSWHWDFGDDQIFEGQNPPAHQYAEAGKYSVTLTVTDVAGASSKKSHDAEAKSPPPPPPPANKPPIADDDVATTDEDGAVTIDVLTGDTDPDGDPLTPELVTQPMNGSATTNANGTITYTPNADFSGSDNFTYRVTDGRGGTSNNANVAITVNAVNDAPAFTLSSSDLSANISETRTEPNWATGITPGPSNESGQSLNFEVTTEDPAFFTAGPSIASDGTLTFTTSTTGGDALVTVVLHDDGGTANGGVDTSPSKTFTIHISGGGEAGN